MKKKSCSIIIRTEHNLAEPNQILPKFVEF